MSRFIRNLTVVEWSVVAASAFLLGTFAYDEVRGQLAERQATADARRDIARGELAFHVGGRRRPWFDKTAAIFESNWGAELVCSYGCCQACADWRYTSRFNELMEKAVSKRTARFSFSDAYFDADDEARNMMDSQLAD